MSFSLKSGFFWAILKDFEFAIYCSLLRRKREESLFWKGSSAIFPPKSHRSAFKLCRKKVERYTLLFVPHDRKSIQKARSYIASPRRKLKSHSLWTVKMRRKIHTIHTLFLLLGTVNSELKILQNRSKNRFWGKSDDNMPQQEPR